MTYVEEKLDGLTIKRNKGKMGLVLIRRVWKVKISGI